MSATFPPHITAYFSQPELSDERALRRAYSKLIKTFTPQSHPAEFQQIREAYEQARAILRGGAAPGETSEAAAGNGQSEAAAAAIPFPDAPLPGDAGLAVPVHPLVGQAIADATADNLEELLVTLTRIALKGDASAVYAGFGIVEALAPKQRMGWLSRVRDAGAPLDAIIGALQALLEVMPETAAGEEMAEFVASVSSSPAGLDLALNWINANIIANNAADAFAGLERFELQILKESPGLWCNMAAALVADVGWSLSRDALLSLQTKLEQHQLRVDESQATWLESLIMGALAYHVFIADPVIPVALHEPIRRGAYAPRITAFTALRDVVAGMRSAPVFNTPPHALVFAHYTYIESYHPGVMKLLRDIETQVTGREAFIADWHHRGVTLGTELNSAAMALNAGPLRASSHAMVGRLTAEVDASPPVEPPSKALFVIPAAYVALALTPMVTLNPILLLLSIGSAGYGVYQLRASQQANKALPAPTPTRTAPSSTQHAPIPADPRERLLSLQRAFGLWAHELAYAAQLYEFDVNRVFPDPILLDPTLDLEGLSDMHLKRVMHESRQSAPRPQTEVE